MRLVLIVDVADRGADGDVRLVIEANVGLGGGVWNRGWVRIENSLLVLHGLHLAHLL